MSGTTGARVENCPRASLSPSPRQRRSSLSASHAACQLALKFSKVFMSFQALHDIDRPRAGDTALELVRVGCARSAIVRLGNRQRLPLTQCRARCLLHALCAISLGEKMRVFMQPAIFCTFRSRYVSHTQRRFKYRIFI